MSSKNLLKCWIARDRIDEDYSSLLMFINCPINKSSIEGEYNWNDDSFFTLINPDLFPEITPENSPKKCYIDLDTVFVEEDKADSLKFSSKSVSAERLLIYFNTVVDKLKKDMEAKIKDWGE